MHTDYFSEHTNKHAYFSLLKRIKNKREKEMAIFSHWNKMIWRMFAGILHVHCKLKRAV